MTKKEINDSFSLAYNNMVIGLGFFGLYPYGSFASYFFAFHAFMGTLGVFINLVRIGTSDFK